jgi:hypothetical protein
MAYLLHIRQQTGNSREVPIRIWGYCAAGRPTPMVSRKFDRLALWAVAAEPLLRRGAWRWHDGTRLARQSERGQNQTFLNRGRVAEVDYVAQIAVPTCPSDDFCGDVVRLGI